MKISHIGSGFGLLILAACAAPLDGDNGVVGTGGNTAVPGTGGTAAPGAGGTVATPGAGGASASGGVAASTGGVVASTGGVAASTGGTPTVSSGGTPATTTGGVTGDGGTPSAEGCTTGAVFSPDAGFADNGTMCGYAWTATNGEGEDITPPCGDGDCFTGTDFCADATIPANEPDDSIYTGVMIGWNVTRDDSDSWTSTGSGITVNFDDGGASGVVRVLIQSGSKDYCAVATSGSAMAWGDFTVDCWETGGAAFSAGDSVDAIVVQVNGSDTAAQTLSGFCLDSVTLN